MTEQKSTGVKDTTSSELTISKANVSFISAPFPAEASINMLGRSFKLILSGLPIAGSFSVAQGALPFSYSSGASRKGLRIVETLKT